MSDDVSDGTGGPVRFLMVGDPAGEVCVDGVCGPTTQPAVRQPEYVDHDLGTSAAGPADAGREAPSSGG